MGLGQGSVGCYVCVSCESGFSVYMAGPGICVLYCIPAHLRCTQCSILLHLMNICFLTCICFLITTINIRHDYRLQQNRQTFTNYKKADWTQFTEDTESAFAQTTIHTANIFFTNIILMADKHNIPKGKMHSYCRLLPDRIVFKITQRNNIRRANTCDPALKLLNKEITSDIQKHKPMEGTLRCTLGSQAQHALSLEDNTRSIQQSTPIHTKYIHNIQQQNSNHIQTHCELFHKKKSQTRK